MESQEHTDGYCTLSIVISNLDKNYTNTIILDNFDNYEDVKEWATRLKKLYNIVKEQKDG